MTLIKSLSSVHSFGPEIYSFTSLYQEVIYYSQESQR